MAHDLGEGNPVWRVQDAGILSRMTGENLAHATTLGRAHRSIYESPSHRNNLLAPYFDEVGIGVAQDADGSFWICELFVDRG